MSLSRHVNPEDIISHLQDLNISVSDGASSNLTPYTTAYASQRDIPKCKIPPEGAPADTVYAMLKDELDLDGRPNLNLASFVDTYLEDNAQKLMVDNLAKNLADNDEYPAMISISERCVSILAHLWGVQPGEKAIGSPTVGSSEAIHLGGLAMKRRWQERRRAEGKDTLRPNILMGANAQVALEKFARYFEVEARILPVSAKSNFCLDPDLVRENIDENTIGVFVILGSTYTSHFEPVERVSKILDEFQDSTGVDISIHVDAASGEMYHVKEPLFTYQLLAKNFELPRVKSINASGTRSSSSTTSARLLSKSLEATGWYTCISDIHRAAHDSNSTASQIAEKIKTTAAAATTTTSQTNQETSAAYTPGPPVVSFRFTDKFPRESPHVKQETVSPLLRARQWIIPNYALPPKEDGTEILRVVVRESMGFDLLDRLVTDIVQVTETLMANDEVDLSLLQRQRRKPVERRKEEEQEQEDKGGEAKTAGLEAVGRDVKRMAEGIHRSVC
ncbi:glutamate decarboxylase [Podospora appendiculata]|uniref:glutamate decarboxylase n=1 Tax=Podospora appendiculata TaxID=314037 RepID=A0AAE0XLJ4_9PEZI|nr:glutamate decarboxylase [Podospora appendiculata]